MSFIPAYILILFFTIMIDYTAGIAIEDSQNKRRTLFLIASLLANIGVLAIFKYFNFLNGNLQLLAAFLHWNYPVQSLGIILPIGLSFHTFQSMSYTIEVYRGNQKAERHPGIFALYVMFYPQLVAGPIERPHNLLHQFYEEHTFDYQRVMDGLGLMLWGFFKKVVVADRLAILVDEVYSHPTDYSGLILTIATLFFAFQIYCDFSGYSDIARGAARVMGFRLRLNFDTPYYSKSISEFWRRWHISLSTWFRDYLYIPLGGSRVAQWRWQLNLFFTFLVSGLWHGANWTFLVWGALHGFYFLLAIWTAGWIRTLVRITGIQLSSGLGQGLQVIATFCMVCFGWIFFRAKTISDGFYIATHLFAGWNLMDPTKGLFDLGLTRLEFVIGILSLVAVEAVQIVRQRVNVSEMLATQPVWVTLTLYYVGVMAVLLLGVFSNREFIYFQF